MPIYESTASSSLLNQLYTFAVPPRHRVRITSQMEHMVSSSSSGSVMPFSSSTQNNVQISKSTLGWSACVGISLLILQYIGSRRERFLTAVAGEGGADSNDSVNSDINNTNIRNGTLFQIVAYQLLRLRDFLLAPQSGGEDYDKEEDEDEESFVLHQGSCHCGSIQFEVSAPRILHVEEVSGDGKLLYPSVRIPESSFRLLGGEEVWQTYHVPDSNSPATQAFSFCRKCAVHLVHAIDSDPFMVSFNVHCLTTPWKKAKPRSAAKGGSAFRRVGRSKKRQTTARSPANRGGGSSNSQSRGTPNRSVSPTCNRSGASPISFDSDLADSPTPPEVEKPVGEVIKRGPSPPFLSKDDSSSLASDNYSFGNSKPVGGWTDEPSPNPFALKRKPNPRYAGSGSISDWPTDTTDTSSYLYADDEHSLYEESVTSAQTDPLPPTVGGTPRHSGTAGISSNYALREKLRSHMSKHMKTSNKPH